MILQFPRKFFVLVDANGPRYIGMHANAREAWEIALGWPSTEEIAEAKKRGWYMAEASVTWKEP